MRAPSTSRCSAATTSTRWPSIRWRRSTAITQADLTVAAFPVPTAEASAFGIIDVDDRGRIIGFIEKPKNPPEMPGRPGWSLVSMGNYMFRREVLERVLVDDGGKPGSRHDFGRDIIPRLVADGARVFVYDFAQNRIPGEPEGTEPYWRDVGTIDSYFTRTWSCARACPRSTSTTGVADPQRPARLPARALRARRRGLRPGRGRRQPGLRGLDHRVARRSASRAVGYDCFVHAGAERPATR